MAQENKYQGVATVGWTSSFNPLKKGPVIAKRIWDTYAEMEAYLANAADSAVPGLLMSVISDSNSAKNGAYLVNAVPGFNGYTGDIQVTKVVTGKVSTISLATETSQDVAYMENDILHI